MIEIINKSIFIFVLILFSSLYLFAQEPPDMEQKKKSPFVLKITYKNPYKTIRNIVKLGIQVSDVTNQYYGCIAHESYISNPRTEENSYYSNFFQPPADYFIDFHVSNKETMIDVFPPIELKPDEAKSFTISFYPSLLGGCSSTFSFEVSGILVFDDGKKEFTKNKYRIMAWDVYSLGFSNPEKDEFMAAINNKNIVIRQQAHSQLHKAPFTIEELKFLINRGLEDQDAGIRAVSALSASRLKFTQFTKKINLLLKNSLDNLDYQITGTLPPNAEGTASSLDSLSGKTSMRGLTRSELTDLQIEIADYCWALGELRDTANAEILISALLNRNFPHYNKVGEALIKLSHRDVIGKLRPFLFKNAEWLTSSSDNLSERFLEICRIIIAYRDLNSVDFLLNNANKSDKLLKLLMSQIENITRKNQIIREPFILGLRPVFEKALKLSKSSDSRFTALKILSLMQIDDEIIHDYFRLLFRDADFNYKISAAELAAELGYKALAGDILLLLKSSDSEYAKEDYCEALTKLKFPCK